MIEDEEFLTYYDAGVAMGEDDLLIFALSGNIINVADELESSDITSEVDVNGRTFLIDWIRDNTTRKHHRAPNQPIEVFPKASTETVTIVRYLTGAGKEIYRHYQF